MIKAKCIDRLKDKNGNVVKYLLIDTQKNQTEMKAKDLKTAIKSKKIQVVNLTLTKDNRLIMAEEVVNKNKINCKPQNVKAKETKTFRICVGLKDGTILDNVKADCEISETDNMRFRKYYTQKGALIDKSQIKKIQVTGIAPKDCSYMFANLNVTRINLKELDTSEVENMSGMFSNNSRLSKLDLSNFNTSKVTDMSSMFKGCALLSELNIENINTSNVEDMSKMFLDCRSLVSLNLSNFNTSNVKNMSGMFSHFHSSTILDFSNFDTSNVEDMSNMFEWCEYLKELNVTSFNTDKVKNMSGMFYGCCYLTSLNLSNFNTSNVEDMSNMFNYCKNLTTLDLSNFDTSKVTNMSYMFQECEYLKTLNISNFNTSNVENMRSMFNDCYKITELDLTHFDTSKVKDMSYMFQGSYGLTSLDISNFKINNAISMENMFQASCEPKYVKLPPNFIIYDYKITICKDKNIQLLDYNKNMVVFKTKMSCDTDRNGELAIIINREHRPNTSEIMDDFTIKFVKDNVIKENVMYGELIFNSFLVIEKIEKYNNKLLEKVNSKNSIKEEVKPKTKSENTQDQASEELLKSIKERLIASNYFIDNYQLMQDLVEYVIQSGNYNSFLRAFKQGYGTYDLGAIKCVLDECSCDLFENYDSAVSENFISQFIELYIEK